MAKISLSFYLIRVYEKRKTKALISLHDLPTKEKELLTNVRAFLDTLEKYNANSVKKFKVKPSGQTAQSDDISKILYDPSASYSNKHLSGTFRAGDGGYASDIVDALTGTLAHSRTINDIEIIPFYFRLQILQKPEYAILALQRFGVYGVNTNIIRNLQLFLSDLFSNHTVRIEPMYVGSLYIEKYIKDGHIKNIEATQFLTPKDKASKSKSAVITQTINLGPTKRGLNLSDNVKAILISKHSVSTAAVVQKVFDMYALQIDAKDFNELKFQVDFKGVRRTIDVGDISRCATNYDISDDVIKVKLTGHPEFNSIDKVTKDMLFNEISQLVK